MMTMIRYRSHFHTLQQRSTTTCLSLQYHRHHTNQIIISKNYSKYFHSTRRVVTSNNKNTQSSSTKYRSQTLTNSNGSSYQPINNPPFDTLFLTLLSRVITGFGILHIFSEYCFEMTCCEGASMMPTIQPSGEIILIEKISSRLYGIEGGDNGEKRAEKAQLKQAEWEKDESRLWLGGKHRMMTMSSSSSSSDDNDQNKINAMSKKKAFLTKEEKDEFMSVHTWYAPKLKQVNPQNYNYLSSWKKCYEKFTSGIAVGDVVVLKHPDRDGTVCKRVLALPGDTVIRPKQQQSSSYYEYYGNRRHERSHNYHRDVMNIFHKSDEKGKGHGNSIGQTLHNSSLFVVPDGHIWVEGDNSNNSSDSRNYGPVSAALVVGKVWMRLWPILRGNTLMVRGSPPLPPKHVPFKGSTALPAGYGGETIVIER